MKTNKTKATIGYVLMILGILIPLYALSSISFNQLKSQLHYEKVQNLAEEKKINKDHIKAYNEKIREHGSGIVDPFSMEDYKTKYDMNEEDQEQIFAYVRIPAIDLIQPIRLGATAEHLEMGAAHVDGTSLPVGGLGTRSVIAAHRGWYKDFMFLYLGELKPGDDVYIDFGKEKLHYRVVNSEVVEPYAWEKLSPNKDEDMLTLLTCDPFIPPQINRLLVNCLRVEEKEEVDSQKTVTNSKNPERKQISQAKKISWLIYMVTILSYILLFRVLWKWKKYLQQGNLEEKKEKSQEKEV